MSMSGMNEAGRYEITVGQDEKHTVDADGIEFTANNELRVWKGGVVVALFSWWNSVVRVGD